MNGSCHKYYNFGDTQECKLSMVRGSACAFYSILQGKKKNTGHYLNYKVMIKI